MIKEIIKPAYECTCDVCGNSVRGDTLPANWMCLVIRFPSYNRQTANVHVCDKCCKDGVPTIPKETVTKLFDATNGPATHPEAPY